MSRGGGGGYNFIIKNINKKKNILNNEIITIYDL